MLRRDNALFPTAAYAEQRTAAVSASRKERRWANLVPERSANLVRDRVLRRMALEVKLKSPSLVLVVGGGAQRPQLDAALSPDGAMAIVYSDIDVMANVDLYCDAHDLPFVDCTFDAVVTTAVLEHVLYPERVAAELARVVKPDGRIYSELPFMQQVHEGAYDFTRYTLSGHRRLLNQFREIEAGMVAGPGTALAWSIEYFVLSFVTARRIANAVKALVRSGTFWLKWIDRYLASRPAAMDGASCTYFYGERAAERTPDAAIVASYVGGHSLSHF